SELAPEYQVCQTGLQQTPIDVENAVLAEVDALNLSYQAAPLKLLNNGHTIQVNYAPGSSIQWNGETFNLVQFHFHHPSEHHVAGSPYDMEMHLVHRNSAGDRLAVIGVFLQQGEANALLQPIWDAMPLAKSDERTVENVQIDVAQLLPTDRRFYTYYGSLTTPPCSEGVLWFVMEQPIEVSQEQIRKFAALFPLNARPIQPINYRYVLRSS
ncbi:MAG TPA: carbonic anhydrase family protein, partial [Allocoleopsis sp.]